MNRTLSVELNADVTRFRAGMAQAQSSLTSFGQKAQSVGSALSVAISAPLGLLAHKAVEAYGELDSLTRGLATLEKSSSSLKARLSELQEVAKLPGLGYREALQFDVSLRSAGFSADLSKRSMMAFGNALGVIGKGKNDLKGLSVQLQQLATKTGGFGADIRIIKEYAPQVGKALQAAFGTIDTEKIAAAGLTGKQVVEKIVAELDKLPKATGGIKNAFENLDDSVFRSMAKLGQSISNALGLEGILNTVGTAISSLVDRFSTLSPPLQSVIAGFGLAAIALPPLLAGLGLLASTVLPAVATGFALLTGPIGLAVAAFAAAATLIVMHWDSVKKFLLQTNLWDTLKDLVGNGLGFITSIFGAFANLFQGDWSAMWTHVQNIFKYAWNGIVGIVGAGAMAVGGFWQKMLSMMGLDKWAKAVETRMNEVFLTVQSRQFIVDSPKAKANLFEGFNFGGDGADKPGKPDSAGDGKDKKVGKFQSHVDYLRQRVGELQDVVSDFGMRNLKVPDDVINSLSAFTILLKRAEVAVEQLKPADLGKLKPIESKSINEVFKPLEFKPISKIGGLKDFQKQMANSFKPVKKAMVDLNKDISDGLRKAAESALVGMGEVIGGLISGTAGLDALPAMLLSVLGSLLQQLGKMAISVGMGVAAIQTALKTLNPFVAIAAGVALLALGGAVKASSAKMGGERKMASGGLISGPTRVLAGEYAGAQNRPEVFAPMDKLGGYLNKYLESAGGGGGTLSTRVSGSDLLFVLDRARGSKKTFGRG